MSLQHINNTPSVDSALCYTLTVDSFMLLLGLSGRHSGESSQPIAGQISRYGCLMSL